VASGPIYILLTILLLYPKELFSIGQFRVQPPSYGSWQSNLHHLVRRVMLSFFVLRPDSMHQTVSSRIRCLSTVLLHHSIILWIVRLT
jgi:hypothetical protein